MGEATTTDSAEAVASWKGWVTGSTATAGTSSVDDRRGAGRVEWWEMSAGMRVSGSRGAKCYEHTHLRERDSLGSLPSALVGT